jgi:hypothetical protein
MTFKGTQAARNDRLFFIEAELGLNAYRLLLGKPEGKRSLGRPRHSSINNINLDLRDIG